MSGNNGGNGKVGAALVVGAGIGGMQAALDLAEAGIKVYLLERETSIGGGMVRLDKTFPTNDCAMCTIGPRLVTVGRHLNIEMITGADVERITGEPGNYTVTVKKKNRWVDIDKCKGCGDCTKNCPVSIDSAFQQLLGKENAVYRLFPQAVPGAFAVHKDGTSPCRIACPAGVNPHAYVKLLAAGKVQEAFDVIYQAMPFAGICGRVCHHPCETECYRGKLMGEPVSICALKRYIADEYYAGRYTVNETADSRELPPPPEPRSEKVAVVGAGPAGLTCARDLAALGYPVTIFDSAPDGGGMVRRVIPDYRLPYDLVKREVDAILQKGIEMRANTAVGKDVSFADLRKDYNAVFVAVGAQLSTKLDIPGEDLDGVIPALALLEDSNAGRSPRLGDKVAVVGGGNVAMDAARTALRLGAKDVTVVYRRSRAEMPANPWEIEEAEEEGVKFHYLAAPVSVKADGKKAVALVCTKMRLGEPDKSGRRRPEPIPDSEFEIPATSIIPAIGQASDLGFLDGAVESNKNGTIKADPVTLETSAAGVFAGGDVVKGPASIVEAVGNGHAAAVSIDRYLSKKDLKEGRGQKPEVSPEPDIKGAVVRSRAVQKRLSPEERKTNFTEVVLALTKEEAIAEAERCLSCATCCECRQCELTCEAKAINHDGTHEELIDLNVGAVLLAAGYKLYDAKGKPELGWGRYANVLTALQFERVLAPTGPFSGHICRPLDGKMPHKVAFIQCVGSRDVSKEANLNYCSAVCCMYATKQAILLKEEHPATEVTIFFIDMRTFGKGYEGFYDRAKKMGIRYVRFKPSYVEEIPGSRNLRLRYISESGQTITEEFEMVILSSGMGPAEENKELAEKFGFELNEFGFCKTDMFRPVETSREGIYSLGVFNGPKDISESVTQGSAAVVKALALLADAKGTMIKDKVYPPERDVTGQDPRIGVFICHCGKNIASVVDVPAVVEYAKTLPNVTYAENFLYACSADSGERMKHIINEYALNRVIVASCTPRTHEPLFQENLKEAGLNAYLFEMGNIRDQCSWVHTEEPEMATKKAKDVVKMAVSKSRLREPLHPKVIGVNRSCLIIGGGLAGMTAAMDLANQGFQTYILEQKGVLGGNLRRLRFLLDGQDPQQKLAELIEKVQNHPKIKVFLNSEILKAEGSVADFKTEFRCNGETQTLTHGTVIIATGAEEYKPQEYLYGQNENVMTQLELEDKLAKGESAANTVVMIQCVGSREEAHPYCSRVCCSQAVKNALKIKELKPETNVFILYRDLRTYAFNEQHYYKARELGVRFIRYEEDKKPTVTADGGLAVTFYDPLLRADLIINTDLVVLSAGTVSTAGNKVIAEMLRVPLNQDNFFLEAHLKLRPVDFPADGLYVCGIGHAPKNVEETITQASAAAARASTILSKPQIQSEATVSYVDAEVCRGCGQCVAVCAYNALELDEVRKIAVVRETVCQGCGACAATCPSKAIRHRNWNPKQFFEMIEAAGYAYAKPGK
jgi:heterodisulfide reductase subunit A-like polyferredoxin